MGDSGDTDILVLRERAVRLEFLTAAWMVIEAAVALFAGAIASSIALVAFGLDSLAELVAALTLLWRLRERGIEDIHADSRAAKVVGLTFFALAAYVSYESAHDLWRRSAPDSSLAGIVLAGVALISMPLLGLAKRRVARLLNSRALAAESMETMFCAYLAAGLLLGLVLNYTLGWWWADPAAALVMAAFMVREGAEAFSDDGGSYRQ